MRTTKCLDHGFVTLRNISGPTRRQEDEFDAKDVDPANSARMVFDNMDSGRMESEDLRLAEYLMKNMLHFLSRRDHFHAQYEARVYAEAIIDLLENQLPHSMYLYRKYRKMD